MASTAHTQTDHCMQNVPFCAGNATSRTVEASTETKDMHAVVEATAMATHRIDAAKTFLQDMATGDRIAQRGAAQRPRQRGHHPCRGRRAPLADRDPSSSSPLGFASATGSELYADPPPHKQTLPKRLMVASGGSRSLAPDIPPQKDLALTPNHSTDVQKNPGNSTHFNGPRGRPWSATPLVAHSVEKLAVAQRPASATPLPHHLRAIPVHQKDAFTLEVTLLSRFHRQVKAGNCPSFVPLLKLVQDSVVPQSAFQSILHQDDQAFAG
eukprot:EG_transcript_24171